MGIDNPVQLEPLNPIKTDKIKVKFEARSTFKHDYASSFHNKVTQGPGLTM